MKPDNSTVERLAGLVMERLSVPRITLEASGRHVHLSRNTVEVLFGPGYRLTKKAPLSQPGQFACVERVKAVGPKGSFSSVVVLGPERQETQLEISQTDARTLGINAPLRLSGDINGTPGINLAGPKGEVEMTRGVIVAKRHIHMTPGYAKLYGFTDGQMVSVQAEGERGLVFQEVIIRISAAFDNYMHIDYDEANACGFRPGMTGVILK